MGLRGLVCGILDQVPNGPSDDLESDKVEFKKYSTENAFHNDKKLPEELSALSNWKGGIIVIGVKDGSNVRNSGWNSQLVGFDHVDLFTTRERLRGRLKPSVDLVVEEIEHQSKNYLVIQTPHSRSSLVATASGKVCVRDGKSSRPMTPDEIEQAVKNLQDYDWSAETLDIHPLTSLDYRALDEAKTDFSIRRDSRAISHADFLEAIGATHNGRLTKSGLLFLGRPEIIRTELGNFEYRFSRKLASGELLINDIWQGCLWHTVRKAKQYFEACNEERRLEYGKKIYSVQLLDRIAFHEAYLNAMVHRDYSVDGMVSVNFSGDRLILQVPVFSMEV
jgi:ATP-dependent DNA helicase RecG